VVRLEDLRIVTDTVGDVVESITPSAVQWVPATVEGGPERRYAMNILHALDAIGEEQTNGDRWPAGHDLAGRWLAIRSLRLHRDLEPEYDVFRVKDWEVAMIMTGPLKGSVRRPRVHRHPVLHQGGLARRSPGPQRDRNLLRVGVAHHRMAG
jgi:hypothetical protein